MGMSVVNANQSKYLLATTERNIEVIVHESEKLTNRTINVEYVDRPSNVVETFPGLRHRQAQEGLDDSIYSRIYDQGNDATL